MAAITPGPIQAGGTMDTLTNQAISNFQAPIQNVGGGSTGSTFSSLSKRLAAASPFMPVGGTLGNLVMNGIGMYMQNKYQKEQQEKLDKWQAMQNAIAVRENAKQWKWMEEDRDYSRAQGVMQNLMTLMNTNKQLENNMVNMWRAAA